MKLSEMNEKQRAGMKRIAQDKFKKKLDDLKNEDSEKWQFIESLNEPSKRLFYKVLITNNSKASAVKAKCLDCCHHQKTEIENCSARLCPLFNVRPYQKNNE